MRGRQHFVLAAACGVAMPLGRVDSFAVLPSRLGGSFHHARQRGSTTMLDAAAPGERSDFFLPSLSFFQQGAAAAASIKWGTFFSGRETHQPALSETGRRPAPPQALSSAAGIVAPDALSGAVDSKVEAAASPEVQAIYAKRLRWYNSAIDRYGREGRASEALELLQDMITAGVEPEDVTLLTVAAACASGGRRESAIGVLEVLTERGITHPGLEVYSAALAHALRGGDVASVTFLVDDVRREVIYPHELRSIFDEWERAGSRGSSEGPAF